MKRDSSEYKRQYMRDMRAARKAGMSTAQYRKQFKEKMERAGEAISKRMRQLGAMPP